MPEVLENKLFMSIHVGEFESSQGHKGSLSTSLNRAPIVTFEDKRSVAFSWDDIIERAIEALEEHDVKNKEAK